MNTPERFGFGFGFGDVTDSIRSIEIWNIQPVKREFQPKVHAIVQEYLPTEHKRIQVDSSSILNVLS